MMQTEAELAQFRPEKDTILTIGVFDGVHLGHQHLISRLVMRAREHNLLSVVVTFRQHPQEVLSPETKLPYLTNLEEKIRLLKGEGVDIIVPLTFTLSLAQMSAEEFITLLKHHLRVRGMVVGPDFALGQGRGGNVTSLRELGKEMGFTVEVVPPLVLNGEIVSSTAIRKALAAGDMRKVSELFGHSFSLSGEVVTGEGRGTKIGFPTINLDVAPEQALPPEGVYASRTYIDGRMYQSMTNIGRRPTFGINSCTIETYILDYKGDLYGRKLKIDIVERLRAEKKFDTAKELKQQIDDDIRRGKAILESRGNKQT